jgi:hypothetical protein
MKHERVTLQELVDQPWIRDDEQPDDEQPKRQRGERAGRKVRLRRQRGLVEAEQ